VNIAPQGSGGGSLWTQFRDTVEGFAPLAAAIFAQPLHRKSARRFGGRSRNHCHHGSWQRDLKCRAQIASGADPAKAIENAILGAGVSAATGGISSILQDAGASKLVADLAVRATGTQYATTGTVNPVTLINAAVQCGECANQPVRVSRARRCQPSTEHPLPTPRLLRLLMRLHLRRGRVRSAVLLRMWLGAATSKRCLCRDHRGLCPAGCFQCDLQ
jgi:hypothetical protein